MNKSITEEMLKSREELRSQLIEKMKECDVSNSELAAHVGKSTGIISGLRIGKSILTPIMFNRLIKATQEIVDHRNKPRGPIELSEEEIQKRISRRNTLNEEMLRNNIDNKQLATHAMLTKSMIEKFRDGSYSITKSKWEIITTALESIRLKSSHTMNTYKNNPVIIEKLCNHRTKHVEGYVFLNIQEKGNALIPKKKFKGHEEQVLNDLRDFGFDCEVHILPDGDYILERINKNA